MATSNPTDRRQLDPDSPAAEDRVVESAVLALVLEEHPTNLTIPELSLAINRDRDDFDEEDAVERAVRELVGAGLLHLVAGLLIPSRPALYLSRLEIS